MLTATWVAKKLIHGLVVGTARVFKLQDRNHKAPLALMAPPLRYYLGVSALYSGMQ